MTKKVLLPESLKITFRFATQRLKKKAREKVKKRGGSMTSYINDLLWKDLGEL